MTDRYLIQSESPLLLAISRLSADAEADGRQPALFVCGNKDKLEGIITDAHIREALAKGYASLTDPVGSFAGRDFPAIMPPDTGGAALRAARRMGLRIVPLLDETQRLIRFVDPAGTFALLPLDVVLMAGGMGRRLQPLTRDLPKPLLPVLGKTLLEHNLDRLQRYGIPEFFISVHHLAHKISGQLGDGASRGLQIHYVTEQQPLGTIGALSLIDTFKHGQVLVMNADLLSTFDAEAFFLEFQRLQADILIATAPYRIAVPYGVLDIGPQGQVQGLHEKPHLNQWINAGIYLIRRELLSMIPRDKAYDATELIQQAIQKGKRVFSWPLLEYWMDIGSPEDYARACQDAQRLGL